MRKKKPLWQKYHAASAMQNKAESLDMVHLFFFALLLPMLSPAIQGVGGIQTSHSLAPEEVIFCD